MEKVTSPKSISAATDWLIREGGPPAAGPSAFIPARYSAIGQILPPLHRFDGESVNWEVFLGPLSGFIEESLDEKMAALDEAVEVGRGDLAGSRIVDFVAATEPVFGNHDVFLWRTPSNSPISKKQVDASSALYQASLRGLASLPWASGLGVVVPAVAAWDLDRRWLLRYDAEYECMWLGTQEPHLNKLLTLGTLEIATST